MITYKILKLLSVLVLAHNYVYGGNDIYVNPNYMHYFSRQQMSLKDMFPMRKRGKRSYSFIDERAKNNCNYQTTSGGLSTGNLKNYSRKQAEQDLNNYIKYPLNWRCNLLNGEYAYFNKKDEARQRSQNTGNARNVKYETTFADRVASALARKGNNSNSSDQTTENLPFGKKISCLDISFGKDYSSNNSNSVLDNSNTGNSKNHLKQSEGQTYQNILPPVKKKDPSNSLDTSNYVNDYLDKRYRRFNKRCKTSTGKSSNNKNIESGKGNKPPKRDSKSNNGWLCIPSCNIF